MTDKQRTTADVLKGLVKTGGDVADKAIDRGGDLANAIVGHTAGLISKLSDDIGIMADRILTMEERIGRMADRIVRTEELMARLTATLADRPLEPLGADAAGDGMPGTPVLDVDASGASTVAPPALRIAGDPDRYLLYLSTGPRFAEGLTVVGKVESPDELGAAWRRGLSEIAAIDDGTAGRPHATLRVSVAVKTVGRDARVSQLSNSVDLVVD